MLEGGTCGAGCGGGEEETCLGEGGEEEDDGEGVDDGRLATGSGSLSVRKEQSCECCDGSGSYREVCSIWRRLSSERTAVGAHRYCVCIWRMYTFRVDRCCSLYGSSILSFNDVKSRNDLTMIYL